MRRTFIIAASALILGAMFSPASAQGQRDQGRNACGGDVRKLCKGVPPVDSEVLSCLQRNRPKLSRACRSMLEQNGV